jgi:signal transduction histidine kinase
VPVALEVTDARYPPPIEMAAYFVVSEALTNAVKHAQATSIRIAVRDDDRRVRVEVSDDGVGGVDERAGSGLAGLRDRLGAHDGTLEVRSPEGVGTTVLVELPCA